MKLQTKYFGTVEADARETVVFSQGIPGFPDETAFLFLPLAEDSPFFIMQSVKTPALAFVTADPFVFFPEYEFRLNDAAIEQLELESEKDVAVYVILTVKEPFSESTANLVAPVVVNTRKRIGKQVVLEGTTYRAAHRLVDEQGTVRRKGDSHARSDAKNK
ncbi:flagellar assembly protein FliW [Caenibacillus caldisaponilyticus]|uniref:flagellar assembly protein FliW n=1 Tax=Caenibacillus caldisaponilyticus TaxID=1674942 RepID=UPI0009883989|nr:flagellar assembly protein FliW [Caenibacillus caldisaponilyticus]